MSHAFLGRITKSYGELSAMLSDWGAQCEFIWVYEHQADEKVANTHCHIFVSNSQRDADGLKKLISWKRANIDKGNKGSSFKTYDPKYDKDTNGNWYNCLAYASKGNLEPVYANGVNANAIAANSRREWKSLADANANVSKKNMSNTDKQLLKHKKTQWDLVEDIRNQMKYNPIAPDRWIGDYNLAGERMSVPETVYTKLIAALEGYKIKAAEYELKRWMDTIMRVDPSFDSIRQNILSRY